jgi:hypothetical protein
MTCEQGSNIADKASHVISGFFFFALNHGIHALHRPRLASSVSPQV